MSQNTDALKLLEILLNAKHFPETNSVEAALVRDLAHQVGIGQRPQRSVDLYQYNFQTGETVLSDITHILHYHTQAELEIERDKTKQTVRELEQKLKDQQAYLTDLESVCEQTKDVYGMYKHVNENHEHIVFDYEMRKGNE